jgi:hypothetical protein
LSRHAGCTSAANFETKLLSERQKDWNLPHLMTILKSILFSCALIVLADAAFAQEPPSPSSAELSLLRDDILAIEKILPQLVDRGAALFELAHDYARLGDLKKAMTLLQECSELHEGFDPENDSAFAGVKNQADFKAIVEQVHREYPPVRKARLAFEVPEMDLIPEGLAVNPRTHVFYMGSLNRRMIMKIKSGGVSEFVPAEKYDIQAVCGIKVDPLQGDVWANTCPESGNHSELLHFDGQGTLVQRFHQSTPDPHGFNDLVLRKEQEIYLTDISANQVLRFDRKAQTFTALPTSRPLLYPNGIALSGDGNLLYIADAFGVLLYDLRSGKSRELQPGKRRTLSGFDGLYWYRGRLIGIQNDLGAPRVADFQLSADGSEVTGATILENRTDNVELPTTGAIDGSDFYFMANTQLRNWKDEKIVDPSKLSPIRVVQIHLH